MPTQVLTEGQAVDRLAALGLSAASIERAIRRAEAEAATCTALDPPMMAGFMRYGRTVRFLREDLLPQGWDYDNPRNFCRTISPGRDFAIVSTSGDEATGNPMLTPTTKYPKGYATAQAVDTNGQLGFDFGEIVAAEMPSDEKQLVTWFLVYFADEEEIRAELSLPSAMDGGNISEWKERIILPVFPLTEDASARRHGNEGDDQHDYIVEVNRR